MAPPAKSDIVLQAKSYKGCVLGVNHSGPPRVPPLPRYKGRGGVCSTTEFSSCLNQCEKKELNYCSIGADCIPDADRGFKCRCKEGYLDNSNSLMYPGEICIEVCPPNFCGENGFCEQTADGRRHCLCNGWHIGQRCEISGIVAAVAEWYRHRIVAGFVTSSSPIPLKTRRVGQRCTLNLSRAETSSRWCGVVVRRGGASSGVVHVT
ncbi:uncharacterized protein TNCV_569301 [Trichonephila clavipes]|nr:uncharacterized protein TNCV_569301 [Trichonephila clavipes]